MNRNYLKSTLMAGMLAAGVAASAQSQPPPSFPPSGWALGPCINPTSTTSPYSMDYGANGDWNDLFSAIMGVSGTVSFDYACFANSVSMSQAGNIGFSTGPHGSAQDEVYPIGAPINLYTDSWLFLNMGGWEGTGGNWSYATTVEVSGTNTTTRTPFGKGGLSGYYYGASDRYFVGESTNGDIGINLRIDILGDSARLSWTLTNESTNSIQIGLEFGQWIRFFQGTKAYFGLTDGIVTDGGAFEVSPWVNAPGYRPLIVDTRFSANPNLNATNPPENLMPNPITFCIDQRNAYGLSLPTVPDPSIPDQTPVDILDVGKAGFLLGLVNADNEPMPAAYSNPPPLLNDTSFTDEVAYVERWLPQTVEPNAARVLVAYYRSTWSKSDYAAPYSAVLDAPNLVPLSTTDITQYNVNPMIIRVYVDNTRGFSTVNEGVPLEDVQVTLNLPQGLVDANNGVNTTITQYIPEVPPTTHTIDQATGLPVNTPMSYVDFEVVVDPGSLPPGTIPQQSGWTNTPPPTAIYGQQSYSVTITPNPGPAKTLTGVINLATRPQLNVANTANLIATPWVFGDPSWATIFAANTNPDTGLVQPALNLNVDFQAYGWDPIQQTYVGSSGPQRGLGYWLLMSPSAIASAKADFLSDRNLEAAAPTEPTDIGTGGLLVDIQPGWNLISNPYDYGIPIGEIVGVSAANPTSAQTYPNLASQGLVSPTLAFWDNNDQSYQFTTTFDDLLQPNTGYWVFVNSPQKITLSFPPVTAPFLPVVTQSVYLSHSSNQQKVAMPTASWKLNMVVKSGKTVDSKNYVGVVSNPSLTKLATIMKPPVAPLPNAVSAAVVQTSGSKTALLAQSLVPSASSIAWNWQVYSRPGGTTTITWPNIGSMPSTLDVKLVDPVAGKTVDMRSESSYTYVAKPNANRNFQIEAVSAAPYTGPILGSLSATLSGTSLKSPFNIAYQLYTNASTTIKVFRGTQLIDTVVAAKADKTGTTTVQWNQENSGNQYVGEGVYTIQVTSTISSGRSDVKSTTVFVNR